MRTRSCSVRFQCALRRLSAPAEVKIRHFGVVAAHFFMLGVSPTCRNDDVALKFAVPAGEVGCRRLIPTCVQPADILEALRAACLLL